MELNQKIVIAFLVIVILILIFSKISVGFSGDQTNLINDQLQKLQNKIENAGKLNTTDTTTSSMSSMPSGFDPKNSGLLSNDFKKQLDEIENKFYYDNCRNKKL
jgi:hypothetical protein